MKHEINNLPEDFQLVTLTIAELETLSRQVVETLVHKTHLETATKRGEDTLAQPEEGRNVLIANWNDVPQIWQDILEDDGYVLDWPDEVIVCEQGKAWNIIPGFYGDMPKIKVCGGYVITKDNDPSEWIEECEMTDYNQPIDALPNWFDVEHLISEGYEKQNEEEFENGLHVGQDDDPAEIAKSLFDRGAESVIFHIPRVGQFDIRFNVWSK